MKKCWIIALALILLTGCGAQQTFETVTDDYAVSAAAPACKIGLSLPEEAAQTALHSQQEGSLYFCEDYTVAVQTLDGSDLDSTLRSVTGYGKDDLSLITTRRRGTDCYECVWTAAGETSQQVGRTVILDDGSYHYTVTVMADAEKAGQLRKTWDSLLGSFYLKDTD